jgi:hypothetical protein
MISRMPNQEISKLKAPCATSTDNARVLTSDHNEAMRGAPIQALVARDGRA